MATFNSTVYAQETGQPSTAVGTAAPIQTYTDGKRSGGRKIATFVTFDTSLQNLASASVVNVCTLPPDVIVSNITVITGTALASSTIQVGLGATANYFSTSAISTATAGKVDAFTNLANYGTVTTANTAPQTVTATIGGASWTTGIIYFLIEYLQN